MTGPAVLDHVLDVDSHEMAPAHYWGPLFGDAAGEISDRILDALKLQRGNDFYAPHLTSDSTEITDATVWFTKGTSAPGAFDFHRRLDVMDEMGVSRQLVFPSFALYSSMLVIGNPHTVRNFLKLEGSAEEIRELGLAGLDGYNNWCAEVTTENPARMRPVAYLMGNGSVDQLVADTEKWIKKGVRGINVPHGVPPAGLSPAHPDMDQFWSLLESNNVPFLTHVGNEQGLLASDIWKQAPAFAIGKIESHELGLEPYSFATLHLTAEHFLTVMTLGGVFERFPNLRVGMIEQGSSWLGPLAEHLDMWARDMYATRLKPFISMLPSEYLNRNVRVTPFNEIEPIARDFKRYPQLANCYCYSTDYPHVEGGKDSKRLQYKQLAPLGDEIVERFFVTNGEWIMPD